MSAIAKMRPEILSHRTSRSVIRGVSDHRIGGIPGGLTRICGIPDDLDRSVSSTSYSMNRTVCALGLVSR